MASMRPRNRKDGSTFWEVLFRHDGRQRSLSFETADHGARFKELVDRTARPRRSPRTNSPRPRGQLTAAALPSPSGWSTTSII